MRIVKPALWDNRHIEVCVAYIERRDPLATGGITIATLPYRPNTRECSICSNGIQLYSILVEARIIQRHTCDHD